MAEIIWIISTSGVSIILITLPTYNSKPQSSVTDCSRVVPIVVPSRAMYTGTEFSDTSSCLTYIYVREFYSTANFWTQWLMRRATT